MQSYKVLWTEDAVSDLDSIIGYIFQESQTTAKEIYLAIKEKCESLEHFPFRRRIVPELESLGFCEYREIIYKRWRIIYSIEDSHVYLLLLIDSRQDIQEQLVRRMLHNNSSY